MLTPSDESLLRSNVRNFYHLVDYNSQFFGEPHILNGFLYYFDGYKVTIVTPRVTGEITPQVVNQTISEIIKKHDPGDLIFWGQTPDISFDNKSGYKSYYEELDPIGHEMVFATADFIPTKKYHKYLNKAAEGNVEFNVVTSRHYKSDYTRLLADVHEDLIKTRQLSYYSVYPKVDSTRFIELTQNGKLIAVQIIIEILPNYACLAEIGYDKSVKDSGGMAVALTIQYYLDKAKYISYGGCSSESIYRYKSELIGKIPTRFYDKSIWFELYKTETSPWWLAKMAKNNIK